VLARERKRGAGLEEAYSRERKEETPGRYLLKARDGHKKQFFVGMRAGERKKRAVGVFWQMKKEKEDQS